MQSTSVRPKVVSNIKVCLYVLCRSSPAHTGCQYQGFHSLIIIIMIMIRIIIMIMIIITVIVIVWP